MVRVNESIVLVGGGGGVYRIARFLKHIRPNITTIQTTFDHGGHSGELRDERGVLPTGDIRQAILALADEEIESDLRALLAHRFSPINKSSLNHATVGNIILTALTEITGSLPSAINVLVRWFGVRGKVLPVSIDNSELCVALSDGHVLCGEGRIDTRSASDKRHIVSANLKPPAHIYAPASEALINADKIVFCPGDLYTSIIPNTLVSGFEESIKKSSAKLIYVVNIMTKKAETHRFAASRFAHILLSYIGRKQFDVVICNSALVSKALRARYNAELASQVRVDRERLARYAKRIITEPLLDETGAIIRHHPRIASVIARL